MDLGMTQGALGAVLGVNRDSVRNWELGWAEPGLRHMPAVLAFLGYDPVRQPATIGEQLRVKRRALGMTQQDAARLLGMSRESIVNWEGGSRVPQGGHLRKVLDFLGADDIRNG